MQLSTIYFSNIVFMLQKLFSTYGLIVTQETLLDFDLCFYISQNFQIFFEYLFRKLIWFARI